MGHTHARDSGCFDWLLYEAARLSPSSTPAAPQTTPSGCEVTLKVTHIHTHHTYTYTSHDTRQRDS